MTCSADRGVRRILWPRAQLGVELKADAISLFLVERARAMDVRASAVARRRLKVEFTQPQPNEYRRAEGIPDRAWRCAHARGEWWCVVDGHSQRAILDIALGGCGGHTQTAAERTIVAEFVERLLVDESATAPPAEDKNARPAGRALWGCNVELASPLTQTATLQLFAAASAPVPARQPGPDLSGMSFDLEAVAPPVRVPLRAVRDWRPGSLVILGAQVDVEFLLVAGARRVATGALGASRRGWSMRIARLAGAEP